MKKDRKMGISPADRKFDVDVFPSKIDQNRPRGTQDICRSMGGLVFPNLFLYLSACGFISFPHRTAQIVLITSWMPRVTIQMPQVSIQGPQVTIQGPQVTIQGPQVTIKAPFSDHPETIYA